MEEGGARRGGHPRLGPDGVGADLISALLEDLLLQVLRRLGCARAAAHTSLLSRHWRGLWRRVAYFTFRDIALGPLRSALDSLARVPEVLVLDIRVSEVPPAPSPWDDEHKQHAARVSTLLRAAADLSPAELCFGVPPFAVPLPNLPCHSLAVHLPCFLRATSIELHMLDLTDFSVLDLHFITSGHGFGAFLFSLLRIGWIRTAAKCLKIGLQHTQVKETCPANCPCDEPENWRSQAISLINLEEVEIKVFEGQYYEFDILRQIFRSAPMLKRMTVRLPDKLKRSNDWCKELYDIFKAYPLVECCVDPSAELTNTSQTVVAA